jgi:hypothetical protein
MRWIIRWALRHIPISLSINLGGFFLSIVQVGRPSKRNVSVASEKSETDVLRFAPFPLDSEPSLYTKVLLS